MEEKDMDFKEKEYKKYVDDHIKNVQKVFEVYCKIDGKAFQDDFEYWLCKPLIDSHDESKYSNEEFNRYRLNFFPHENEKKNKESFNHAWNHHQKSNPHHWQFWIMWKPEGSIALDMPFQYIFEMLCDWSAMAVKFKDLPSIFYTKNKDSMFLSESTRKCIELYLPDLDNVVSKISLS